MQFSRRCSIWTLFNEVPYALIMIWETLPHHIIADWHGWTGDKHFHTIQQIILPFGKHYLKAISHMEDEELRSVVFKNIFIIIISPYVQSSQQLMQHNSDQLTNLNFDGNWQKLVEFCKFLMVCPADGSAWLGVDSEWWYWNWQKVTSEY